jgi:hypothetical protein
MGIIDLGFGVAGHLLIRLQGDGTSAIHRLQVRREVLYNNLIEFAVPMKLLRLIKMCLNETYSIVRIRKHLIVFLSKMV